MVKVPPDYDYEAESQAHTPYPVPKGHSRDSNGVKVYASPYALPENMSVLDRAGYEKELEIAKLNQKKKGEKYKLGNFYISYPYQVYVKDGKFQTADPSEQIPISGIKYGTAAMGTIQALPQVVPYVYFISEAFDYKLNRFFKYGVAMEVSELYLGYPDNPPPPSIPSNGTEKVVYHDESGKTYKDVSGGLIMVYPGTKPAIDRNGNVILDEKGQVVIIKENEYLSFDYLGNAEYDASGKLIVTTSWVANKKVLLNPATVTREQKLEQKSIYYDLYLEYINRGKKNGRYFAKSILTEYKPYETSGDGLTPPRAVVTRQDIITGNYDPSFWTRVEREIGELFSDLEMFAEGLFFELLTIGEEIVEEILDHPLLLIAILAIGGVAIYSILK